MAAIGRRGVLTAASGVGALVLSACSGLGTLQTLNTLTPGDGGVVHVVDGAAFGDDPLQRLDVYAPARARDTRVLVFFYGGSWSFGRRQDYAFVARAFAARGFVVVVPDYRKVPQVRFPAFIDDGTAALAWTRANVARYGGNPARLAVAGHSAGAYIAALLALDPRRVPAGTIKAFVGLAGPYDFFPFEPGGAAERAFGATSDPKVTQPISFARADAPPGLLMTGDDDTTVKPRNSVALAAALTAAGARAEVVRYPGIGHVDILLALSKPFRGKAPVLADAVRFLDREV